QRKLGSARHHRSSSDVELGGRDGGYDPGQIYGGFENSKGRTSLRPAFSDLHFDQGPKSSTPLASQTQQHLRGDSEVSTSWLNTVDESGGSMSESSSRTGSRPGSSRSRIRRMRLAAKQDKFSAGSQDNKAEVIGAEMEAAVDAAWDAFSSDAE